MVVLALLLLQVQVTWLREDMMQGRKRTENKIP
jgi:hypothetical protein